MVGSPIAGTLLAIFTVIKLFLFLLGLKNPVIIAPKELENVELAVVITGCDTGFGKDLAFTLGENGFKIFAACLFKESFQQFEGK